MYAPISLAATGVIVAGLEGKKIRVISYLLMAASEVTLQWQSGATALSGAMTATKGNPVSKDAGPMHVTGRSAHFETGTGEDLNLALGGAVQVSGHLEYDLVTVS